jgi:pimeloyl-ACP methyl ester carboxylesterase
LNALTASAVPTVARAVPDGDGHPVIIIPGRAADRRALMPLRNWCEALGYAVYDWEQGFRSGARVDAHAWLHNLAEHVRCVATLHARRVSLVGWRLGGQHARKIAQRRSHLVRQVVTLETAPADDATDDAADDGPTGTPAIAVTSISSHIGMPWHPQVLSLVAERLRQPESAWHSRAPAMPHEQAREARHAGNQSFRHLGADGQPDAFGHRP